MKTGKTKVVVSMLALAGLVVFSLIGYAGNLEPSGPPGPTMKTLQEVEPRTPIDSLPFTIDFSGSYYVTGDLLGSPVDDGITINADNVTLDLRGFTLTGVLEVQPNDGIVVNGVHENITIHNGVLRNWVTAIDASAATNSQIRNLRAEANGGDGIKIGGGGSVVQCSAQGNTGQGIDTGDGCTITGCTARGNSDTGIRTGQGSTVTACTASSNTGESSDGIYASSGSTVTGCTAYNNGNYGIRVRGGCTVTGCTASSNGDDGINADGGSTVTGCTAYNNSGNGISVDYGSMVRGCATRLNGIDGILADQSLIHGNSSKSNVGIPINATDSTLLENHI
ncbi:MAG: right-handed parallel beta-helix repeat-containing protein [Planctomycetota bacterium]|jgi:parallel beta-helix repeat protein